MGFLSWMNITVQCDVLKIVDRDGKILMEGDDGEGDTILVAPGILSMLTDFLDEQFSNMTMEEMSDSLDEQLNALLVELEVELDSGTVATTTSAGFVEVEEPQGFSIFRAILYFNIAVVTTAVAGGLCIWHCS